jgi:hypothetical protein
LVSKTVPEDLRLNDWKIADWKTADWDCRLGTAD